MKITIGYYDRLGRKIRTKTPKPGTNFYLVMGTIRRKIRELEDTTPYKVPINEYSVKFNDKKRLILEMMYFVRGRFDSKIPFFRGGKHYMPTIGIRYNIEKTKSDIARRFKIKTDNIRYA